MANQKIKCDVESCKFQDNINTSCTLEEIKVSCDCDNEKAESKDETICKSFECDYDKLENE